MHASPSALALIGATLIAAGCIAVPTGPDGHYVYYPLPAGPSAYPATPGAPAPSAAQFPSVLQARLYPANEVASQTGVVSGTVTNMMTGKGRFQLAYQGDTLIGEATRVDGDARRGVASAYGAGGAFMSCDYQMSSPRQGAGTCNFSNGAQYRVHIGI